MQTRTLVSSIPLSLADRLDAMIEQLEIPIDDVIADAIAAWIEREEERRLMPLRAMAFANSMAVEGHRILDWADSLSADRH
jgi:limonene-1,2-epoxide hydrolase